MFVEVANLGDAKSTIPHPVSTTYGCLSDKQRAAAWIKDGLIRLAVGLKDVEVLIRDFARGLVAMSALKVLPYIIRTYAAKINNLGSGLRRNDKFLEVPCYLYKLIVSYTAWRAV